MGQIFKQGDTAWGSIVIGHDLKTGSPLTMAGSGCAITSLCQAFNDHGLTTDNPGIMANKLLGAGAIAPNGDINWIEAAKLYGAHYDADNSGQTVLYLGKISMKDALTRIFSAYLAGKMVLVQLDLSPHNGQNQGDHFADMSKYDGVDMEIKDPWFGWQGLINAVHDGFQGYGTPDKAVYGFRIFSKVTAPITAGSGLNPASFSSLELVKKGDGNGELACFHDGKMLRGSQGDVLAYYMALKFGNFVSTDTFNQYPSFDIKNPDNQLTP